MCLGIPQDRGVHRYLLIVDLWEDGEPTSHALYFRSTNGQSASEYAELWMTTQYDDLDEDEDYAIKSYELFFVRTVGDA